MNSRCLECKKKIPEHMLFKCVCETNGTCNKYCIKHLQPEQHKCTKIQSFRNKAMNKVQNVVEKNSLKTSKVNII